MVWEPFALAVVMGLLVSAGIYFIVMWPQVEPPEDIPDEVAVAADDDADGATPAAGAASTGEAADAAVSSDA